MTSDEKLFIKLYEDGYLEDSICLKMNLSSVEYETMYNKLITE